MSLSSGTRLGPYEVVEPAGAGGMGEVYRARDTRLGREVALKVLPARFAADPDFRRRLDREAKAVSSLSHPHVCPLYDVGHAEGVDFLVMEYLEGETLAQRLTRGALPLDQVLRYGIEIADALSAAHRKDIVHRDLKPGNIMLTRAGARLLDFGLAKPASLPMADARSIPDVTISAPITAQGTVIGTFQYMSPEQIEGKEADARSDIFALGAVVYEMATGRRAFDGRSPTSVIAAILEREPPTIASVQPLAPAALDDVVKGCLTKDPEDRWQTAHDVKLQLQGIRRHASEPARVEPVRRRSLREPIAWALVVVAIAAAIWFALRTSRVAPQAGSVVRASILPPGGHSFTPQDFAISPDGSRVAFVAASADGVSTLWVRSLSSSEPLEISGTEDASLPFWSPDGRWVGFFTRGKLWKAEPGGTGVQPICDTLSMSRGGAWGSQDTIVFATSVFGPLMQVPASGGTPVAVTTIPSEVPGEAHRYPQFLPDGRRFLYVVSWTRQERAGLYLGSLDGGPPQLLAQGIQSRPVLSGDHLLYVSGGTVYAQPFDTTQGRIIGSTRPIIQNEIAWDWRFSDMPLSASANGIIVYQSRLTYRTELVWYDRGGREQAVGGSAGFSAPALSPDGRRVAVAYDSRGNGQTNVWIHDLQRNITTPLTDAGTVTAHAWSADGKSIAYSAMRKVNGLFRRAADGSGGEQALLESPLHMLVNAWSPDGAHLLFMDFSTPIPQLRALDVASKRVEVVADGAEGVYSPDGRWIACLGYPGGGIFIRPVGSDAKVQISSGPGSQARWRADMKEIFYISSDRKLMSVPLTRRDGTLEPGTPVPLFQTRILQPRLVLFQYDVTADGQRFLINSLPRENAAAPLTLLMNWMNQ